MLNNHIRYLAAAFVDASSVNLNPQDAATLVTALGAKLNNVQLLANVVNEQTPAGSIPRYAFLAADGSWQILLLSGRFDVVRVSGDPIQGSSLGDHSIFCKQASDVLTVLLDHFQMRPHRLAAAQEGLLREMSDEEMTNVAQRLMRFPSTYASKNLTEWDWRAVTEISREFGEIEEPVNTITTIKRTAGIAIQLGRSAPTLIPIRRIRVEFDMNTLPSKTVPRFTSEHVRAYFTDAVIWHQEIASDLKTVLPEG